MNGISICDDNIELQLTDEEFNLVTSTIVGMGFWINCQILSSDCLIDLRIKYAEEIQVRNSATAKEILKSEIRCIDFLLSLRTYIEENSPKSKILIENSVDDDRTDNRK
jgi:hypothetical protein